MSQAEVVAAGFFQELELKLAKLSPPVVTGVKRDRVVIAVVLFGMLLALAPFGRWVGDGIAPWLTLFGIVAQASGLTVLLFRQARDVVPDFIDAKLKFAADLDEQFERRARLIAWLRSVPPQRRAGYLAYVDSRLETLHSRYPLIFGPVDKLGFLPVLAGFAIQLHAVKSVSLLVMVLGLWVVILYGMGLWMARFRLQLESYRRVLCAADDSALAESEASK